jgi:hypothetical protein
MYRWDETAAWAADQHAEPVHEERDGWWMVNRRDLLNDVVYVGERRSCRHGHECGIVDRDYSRDGSVVAFDPKRISVDQTR